MMEAAYFSSSPAYRRHTEHGFLAFDGRALRVPVDVEDKPKREYLEERYAAFKAAG